MISPSRARPEDVAAVFWSTFSGAPRHAAHNGQHWQPMPGDPSPETVISALAGDGPPLSTFFLDDNGGSHVYAIDVDAEDGWPSVLTISTTLIEAGVECYPERSRRGGHLWIVVDRVIPAIIGRRALMAALQAAGLDPADPKIELRPSTDRHTSEFAGGSLRGPWMRHPDTGDRFGLLDPRSGEPLHAKVAGALLLIEFASAAAMISLAARYVAPPLPARQDPADRREDDGSTISGVLLERFGLQVVPGRSLRCPFHPDRNPSMKVALDDRRAWCHATDCPAHENGRGITAWQAQRLAGAA